MLSISDFKYLAPSYSLFLIRRNSYGSTRAGSIQMPPPDLRRKGGKESNLFPKQCPL
jgi:hypothetical protein